MYKHNNWTSQIRKGGIVTTTDSKTGKVRERERARLAKKERWENLPFLKKYNRHKDRWDDKWNKRLEIMSKKYTPDECEFIFRRTAKALVRQFLALGLKEDFTGYKTLRSLRNEMKVSETFIVNVLAFANMWEPRYESWCLHHQVYQTPQRRRLFVKVAMVEAAFEHYHTTETLSDAAFRLNTSQKYLQKHCEVMPFGPTGKQKRVYKEEADTIKDNYKSNVVLDWPPLDTLIANVNSEGMSVVAARHGCTIHAVRFRLIRRDVFFNPVTKLWEKGLEGVINTKLLVQWPDVPTMINAIKEHGSATKAAAALSVPSSGMRSRIKEYLGVTHMSAVFE